MLGDYLYVLSNKEGYTKLTYEREIKSNDLNSTLQSELIEILISS